MKSGELVNEIPSIEISVVVPILNDVESVEPFVQRVVAVLEKCSTSFEIVFAVDPSTDGTESKIQEIANRDPRVRGLVFSRRFGQPSATIAGLENCRGAAAVVMDCDLQDPPELIPDFVQKWRQGYEVVYARRLRRQGETIVKRVMTKVGYAAIHRFSEVKIPRDTGDFRLLSRRVIDHVALYPEAHGFLKGMVALVGFKQTEVTFVRPGRFVGSGHYNRYIGSLRPQLNGLIAFSTTLLNVSTYVGFIAAAGSFILGTAYFVLKVMGLPFPTGNPTIVILILLLGGIQLICLGITGQYIGRIYDEVKRRPRYIIDYEICAMGDKFER